jgi:preprotein translocase SecE subunit
MATNSQNDGRKWVQTSVAIFCMVSGYVISRFLLQLGVWFELESKIKYFPAYAKGGSVLVGLIGFIYIMNNEKTSSFLKEVYAEMIKVAFPDRSQTARQTIGIMIGVGIVGFMLGFFDFSASYLLSLVR